MEQQAQRSLASPTGRSQMECFPFVRLFRRYVRSALPRSTAWGLEEWHHRQAVPGVQPQTGKVDYIC